MPKSKIYTKEQTADMWRKAFQDTAAYTDEHTRRSIMSYDVSILDKEKRVMSQTEKHQIKGGTYEIGGTKQAWLNITYNYSEHFVNAFGKSLKKVIHGKSSKEIIPILEEGIKILGTNTSTDYWESTPGNAGKALQDLKDLCTIYPEGTIDIS